MRKNKFFRIIFNSKIENEFIEFLYETKMEKNNKEYEFSLKKSFDKVVNNMSNINTQKLKIDANNIQSEINDYKNSTAFITNKKLKILNMTQEIMKINNEINKIKEKDIKNFKFDEFLRSPISSNLIKVFNDEMRNSGFFIVPDTIDISFNFSDEYSKDNGEFLCVTDKEDFITFSK